MRRQVLLVMLLSLALSLSKGSNPGSDAAAPEPIPEATSESVTESTAATNEPTTVPDGVSESTAATNEPTTAPDGVSESTAATNEPTTAPDGVSESTAATPEPTTVPGDPCKPDPCGTQLAKCIALYSNFTCQCQYGFYYKEKNCHQGLIFPGVVMLTASYNDSVGTVNSMQYEEVFKHITTFFKDAFTSLPGFEQTVIVNIEYQKKVRAAFSTNVTVINLFLENANVTNKTVSMAITNATKESPYVSDYRGATYCEAFNCDNHTTECIEKMFPECKCRSNFSSTQWDVLSCSDCSKDCSDKENKYCANERGFPVCKCKPDYQRNDDTCVPCPVGYSGENCNNNRELILIIVGTVFGAIILSLVIAVSVVSVRAKHKQDPEKKSLIKSGYSNPNTSDDRQNTMFPRVQTTSGHANSGYQPNNPYEMRSPNRSRFPDRDYDDMYEVSREPEGFRMQSRY